MKILFITHFFAPDSGAASKLHTRLAQRLHQRGHDVTVLTTMPHYPQGIIPDDYRGKWQVIEDRDGVHVIQMALWASPSRKISRRLLSQLSFMLTCALRGIVIERPDVIFIENQPIFTGLAGWFVSKVKRTPYVMNVADHWPEYLYVAGIVARDSLIYRLFEALTNLTQRDADAITAMYANLLDKMALRIGPVENSHVIYDSVDLWLYQDQDERAFRDKYNLGDQRLVTFLGILGPHIDLETMLAVVAQLRDYEDVTVLFVSAGAQQDALDEALKQPQFDHCQQIDWLPAEEVPALWAVSYLTFWAVADNELDKLRFQTKLYEAIASGTPTVIAVEGLMSDILQESQAGIAVPHGDVPAMRDALRHLLDEPDYHAQMSARGRAYGAEHFDAEKQTIAYENALKSVARQP
ncbi:MAG: glycosyltransferase family 4 protein [Anaerolineae bacterium]